VRGVADAAGAVPANGCSSLRDSLPFVGRVPKLVGAFTDATMS
jgi:hypothetical protein